MRTVKTIEKFNAKGKLIERIVETTDTQEMSPLQQPPSWPYYLPYSVPYMPSYSTPVTCEPSVTWTTYATN